MTTYSLLIKGPFTGALEVKALILAKLGKLSTVLQAYDTMTDHMNVWTALVEVQKPDIAQLYRWFANADYLQVSHADPHKLFARETLLLFTEVPTKDTDG